MENEKQNQRQEQVDEEISLLDLFTVLLRYRRLVVAVSVFFVALAVAGYFIYPAYQYKKALANKQTQGSMLLEIAPKAAVYISQTLENFLLKSDIIYESLYRAGMEEFDHKGDKLSMSSEADKQTIMYIIDMLWIKNLDFNGNIYIPKDKEHLKAYNVRKNGTTVELAYKDKDAEILKRFMDIMYELVSERVAENLQINAKMMVNNYERIANLQKISESMQLILEKDFDTYIFMKDFLDGKEMAVKRVGDPIFVETIAILIEFKRAYVKTGIILVFAGVFIAVFLAFGLNVIRNIKNDEEAMKKIRDALGKSAE